MVNTNYDLKVKNVESTSAGTDSQSLLSVISQLQDSIFSGQADASSPDILADSIDLGDESSLKTLLISIIKQLMSLLNGDQQSDVTETKVDDADTTEQTTKELPKGMEQRVEKKDKELPPGISKKVQGEDQESDPKKVWTQDEIRDYIKNNFSKEKQDDIYSHFQSPKNQENDTPAPTIVKKSDTPQVTPITTKPATTTTTTPTPTTSHATPTSTTPAVSTIPTTSTTTAPATTHAAAPTTTPTATAQETTPTTPKTWSQISSRITRGISHTCLGKD